MNVEAKYFRHTLFLAFALSLLSLLVFNVDRNLEFKNLLESWNTSHYAVNYFDFGFVKRGLVGSFYYLLFDELTQKSLLIYQVSMLIVSLGMCFLFFKKIGYENSFLFLLFIISPATVMQFSSDLGRFDSLLLCFFLLSILCLKNRYAFCFFSCLGVLTHEIYIFLFLPASFLLFLGQGKEIKGASKFFKEAISEPLLYAILCFILMVLLFGKYEDGHSKFMLMLSQKMPVPELGDIPVHSSFWVWTRDIADNLNFTFIKFSQPILVTYYLVLLVGLGLYFKFLKVPLLKFHYLLIILTSLPMFVLGTDWARWISLMYISIFVTFVYLNRNIEVTENKKKLIAYSFFGPLGVGGISPLALLALEHLK